MIFHDILLMFIRRCSMYNEKSDLLLNKMLAELLISQFELMKA